MPLQLQGNADISMARADAPCDKRQSHRALVHASPGSISNPLQLLPRAIPGTTRLKLIICIRATAIVGLFSLSVSGSGSVSGRHLQNPQRMDPKSAGQSLHSPGDRLPVCLPGQTAAWFEIPPWGGLPIRLRRLHVFQPTGDPGITGGDI